METKTMTGGNELIKGLRTSGGQFVRGAPGQPIASYGDAGAEYAALENGPALIHRADRACLEIRGRDRISWLHNLVTNQIKTLSAGEGNGAYVLNVQGRIQFDANVLVRRESILLDLDTRFLETAKRHLSKYTIVEDVQIVDRSADWVRIALAGPLSRGPLETLGAFHAAALPLLNHCEITWCDVTITLFRTDFCGPVSWELLVPVESAESVWKHFTDANGPARAVPVGEEAVQIRRIEAGIPWPGHEITDEYLPAETRQLSRTVNFQKGCYLGQEVVERMRSRGVVARQLVALAVESDHLPPRGSVVQRDDGTPVGTLTSVCRSPALGGVLGLGYAKTAQSTPGERLRIVGEESVSGAHVICPPWGGAKTG